MLVFESHLLKTRQRNLERYKMLNNLDLVEILILQNAKEDRL